MSKRSTSDPSAKQLAALRRLDIIFGAPESQMRNWRSRADAQASAATLIAAQMKMTFASAMKAVDRWYALKGL